MQETPMVGEFVRYVCAFCGQDTADDSQYVHLTVDWPHSGESQWLGAHAACLRSAIHETIDLAVE